MHCNFEISECEESQRYKLWLLCYMAEGSNIPENIFKYIFRIRSAPLDESTRALKACVAGTSSKRYDNKILVQLSRFV